MLLTIGELARKIGVSVVTLRRWDKAGKMPPYLRTLGGHRRYLLAKVLEFLGVPPPQDCVEADPRLVVGYARVSSHDQKEDLQRQKARLEARLAGQSNVVVITDLGSGLNFKKRGLTQLIGLILRRRVERIVLTHKDRLVRFGFELLERMVAAHGGTIEILDDTRGPEEIEL